MTNRIFRTLLFGLLLIPALALAQDTLRVMTYNILNFAGSSTDRLDELRTIIYNAQPDILVNQEVIDQSAVTNILNQVCRPMDVDWEAATFVNGPDTDNACFYLSSRVTLTSQRQIPTSLRDFTEYVFSSPAMGDEPFRIYSGHLKASSGPDNEERRRAEAQVLRNELNELPDNSYFMFVGDFNLYSSFEPAYQLLLALGDNPNGRLLDPINRPGQWSNSVTFAEIHTQSPRTASFGGGATGGMDDRFDFILASAAWMDTSGSYVMPSTYHAYGNDGLHFNDAINDGVNQAVPDSVADALHGCADHLPVIIDVVLRESTTPLSPIAPVVVTSSMLHCYPNPFNSRITVELSPSPVGGELRIRDILGRTVGSMPVGALTSTEAHSFDFTHLSSGAYFVTLRRGTETATTRIILQK